MSISEIFMEYNSQKERLVMPEYGRNVQKLAKHAREITDKTERQAYAEEIIDLMYIMNPQSRNVDEYRVKLWKHFFKIAGYDLDVTPTEGEKPTPEDDYRHPDKLPYPSGSPRYRHYGSHVQRLIKRAKNMEAGPVRDGFAVTIASYMKLAYKAWNKEHYVSNEVIVNDLNSLSGGVLKVGKEVNLDTLAVQAAMPGGGGGGNGKKRHSQSNRSDKGRRQNNRRRRK